MKKNKPSSPSLKKPSRHQPLPWSKLRWHCDPKSVDMKPIKEPRKAREIIGQERALRALRVGLEMKHYGYNIFVTGFSGTGRTTTIKRMLLDFEKTKGTLRDHCYVHNFENPDMPIALSLPAGQGRALRDDMENFVGDLLRNIPSVYESQRYQQARKGLMQHFQDRQKSVLQDFEGKVKEKGFSLVQVQVGNVMRPDIVPVVNGNPTNLEQVEAMVEKAEVTKEQFEVIREAQSALEKQMNTVFRELRNIEKKVQHSMMELEEKIVMPVVDDGIQVLKATYDDPKVQNYLEDVRTNIRENLDRFRKQQLPPDTETQGEEREEDTFLEFRVNVLVDNSEKEHVPIIIETNPRYRNVFGSVERELDKAGMWHTDFMHVKAGSLLGADGGYLVLNALDTLGEQGVWQDLKRTLRTSKLEFNSYEPMFGLSVSGMKPEPIDLNVKVIIIGETELYHLLYYRDEDFKKIFKIRADFDFEMDNNTQAVSKYAGFIRMICEDEKLIQFDTTAVAHVVEFGVRLSGRQQKLSTRFNVIADVVREASYWASKNGATHVTANDVRKALDERIYRVNLVEDKIHEMITTGTIMVDTKGSVVGQVNGLSVYDMGEHAFGRPSRITAKTSLGRLGVINVEREAELSGPTHNKGVAIISGYLRSKFAQEKPMIVDASITFEQSYGGVDGDSASSTEIYAILSSLAELPVRQDVAVTGSVNQKGEIQPIGGVNLKAEGFFDVCKANGLTGTQGVMIPIQNVPDLMLREDVVAAVKKRQFHIWAVSRIEEGVEILMGCKAGNEKNGSFETGTVFSLADRKLTKYAEEWKRFERGKE